MGEREVDPRLQELYDKNVPIYSISRLGTFNGCLYEAYNTYVNRPEVKPKENIYGLLGTKVHDTLESIVNGTATEEDLLPAMNSELDDLDLLGIHFPKDFKGGDSIRESWITDMKHFCTTYKSPRQNLTTEQFFVYKTPKGRHLIGYIDLQHLNKDGSISIYDYKTSSMYSGEDIVEHGYQLIVYALGKEQEGFHVRDVSWIFLKYVTITFLGKKTAKSKEKSEIVKMVERKKIGSEMAKYVEQDLFELGYDEIDANIILNELKETNSFDCLPEEIRNNYKMKPCVYKYELSEETKQQCIDYIDSTIDMWEKLDKTSNHDFPPRAFTKTQKNGKVVDDVFYCLSLCSWGHICPYIKDYMDQKSLVKDEEKDEFAELF